MDVVEDRQASCNPRVALMGTFSRALKSGGDAGADEVGRESGGAWQSVGA
jgi:hypothetical protein